MATSSEKYQKLPVVDGSDSPPPPYPATVQVVQPGVPKVAFTTEVREQPKMGRINMAIFAMICCFWPLGIVALFKAIRGMQAHYNGDRQAADALNKSSKKWSIASIVVGVCIIVGCYALAMIANTLPRILIEALSKNGTEGYDSDHDHYHHGHHDYKMD